MTTNDINYTLFISSLINKDPVLLTKMYLLQNPQTVLLFIRRVILNLNILITNQLNVLNELKQSLNYLNREENIIDSKKIQDYKNSVSQLVHNSASSINKFNESTSNLLKEFKLIKTKSIVIGSSKYDAMEDIYAGINAYKELNTQMKININYIINAINSWLNSDIDKDVFDSLKQKIDINFDNVNKVSFFDTVIDILNSQTLLSNLKIKNPMDEINTTNMTIESIGNETQTSSTSSITSNHDIDITIGNINRKIKYPTVNAYKRVFLLGDNSAFAIPPNSSLYLEIVMKPGVSGPESFPNLPQNVIKIDLASGVRTIASLMSELNTAFLINNTLGNPTQFCLVNNFDGKLLIYGNSDVQSLRIVSIVSGSIVGGSYIYPRYSANKELGFLDTQTSEFSFKDLNTILLYNNINSSILIDKLIIKASNDITIGPGMLQDLGFQSTKVIPSYLELDGILDLKENDEIYVNKLTLIVNYIQGSNIYIKNLTPIIKSAFKVRGKAQLEIERIQEYLTSLIIDKYEKEVDETTLNLFNSASSEEINKVTILLNSEIENFSLIQTNFILNWNPTKDELNNLSSFIGMLEEKSASNIINMLNTCQFDNLSISTLEDKVLTNMASVGKEI